MVARNIDTEQPPIFYLKEKTGKTTSDLLTSSLIEEFAREHPDLEINYDVLMELHSRTLIRLGYTPRKQDLSEKYYSGLTYNSETRIASTKYAMLKPLSPTKDILMKALIGSPEKAVSRDILLGHMGIYIDGYSERGLLKVNMSQLRQTLRGLYEQGGENEFHYPTLVALKGTGYRLTNQVPWKA